MAREQWIYMHLVSLLPPSVPQNLHGQTGLTFILYINNQTLMSDISTDKFKNNLQLLENLQLLTLNLVWKKKQKKNWTKLNSILRNNKQLTAFLPMEKKINIKMHVHVHK